MTTEYKPTHKPITLRQKSVKSYVTEEGVVVEPHEQRYRVIEDPKKDEQTVHRVYPRSKPIEIPKTEDGKFKHTSKVYAIQDNKGRTGYFKPQDGAAFGIVRNGEFRPYRRSIQDDRLCQKEVLASNIARTLHIDGIPHTSWVGVSYKGKNLGEGAIQVDARDLLKSKGYSAHQMNFSDWESMHWERYKKAHALGSGSVISPQEFKHSIRKSTLQNGGMDIAFFDFIIGNTDRHRFNYFVGMNPTNGAHKIAGIDHGLSFPNSTTFGWSDYKTSYTGLWNHATIHGKDVDCSQAFKNAVMNPATEAKLKSLLEYSKLNQQEISGTINRFKQVKDRLSTSKKLMGDDLMHLLKSNLKGRPLPS